MNLVTLMNYDDPKGIAMCKGWLWLARRFNPYAKIIVLYHDKIREIQEFAHYRIGNVWFERMDLSGITPKEQMNGFTFYCQDLTFGRWLALERLGIKKYIFAEADAWILSDLSEWWGIADEKPFIAVLEDGHPTPPYFNIGVFSHNSFKPFFTYAGLMAEYCLCGNRIPISIGDQGLMNVWAKRTGYDASHPKIGKEYNCPTYDRMAGITLGRCDETMIEVYDSGKRVKILHTWGPRKWWDTPELAPICEYIKERIL